MCERIIKELQKRGTCEVSENDIVMQVTQALDEKSDKVTMLMFGELATKQVRPVEQTCKACSFWKDKFESIKDCQTFQKKDSEARGFRDLICPEQFLE